MSSPGQLAGDVARSAIQSLVRLYYRKIHVDGRELVPASGPILCVANHANSLVDPVVLSLAVKRPVRFLAKAPLFEVPVFGDLMHALGMLPAYRAMDDASQVSRNLETLATAAGILVKGETVGLFPEGKSHDAPKVDKVKSGAARIALQAVREGAANLAIVPLGLNYEDKARSRTRVWIQIGAPLVMSDWLAGRDTEDKHVQRELTSEIDRRLKKLVIHLDDPQREPLLDDLGSLVPLALNHHDTDPVAALRERKRIADAMNYFLTNERDRAERMAAELKIYHDQVVAAGLTVNSPVFTLRGGQLLLRNLWLSFLLVMGLIPTAIGTIHHLLPFVIVRGVAALRPAKGKMATTTTRLWLGVPVYALWYAIVWWWIHRENGALTAALWIIAMPLAGIFALGYWRQAREVTRLFWQELQALLQRPKLTELRERQSAIYTQLRQFADEFQRV